MIEKIEVTKDVAKKKSKRLKAQIIEHQYREIRIDDLSKISDNLRLEAIKLFEQANEHSGPGTIEMILRYCQIAEGNALAKTADVINKVIQERLNTYEKN